MATPQEIVEQETAARQSIITKMSDALKPLKEAGSVFVTTMAEVWSVLVPEAYALRRTFLRRVVPSAPETVKKQYANGTVPDIAGSSQAYRDMVGDWFKANVSEDDILSQFAVRGLLTKTALADRVNAYAKENAEKNELYANGLVLTSKRENEKRKRAALREEDKARKASEASLLGAKVGEVDVTIDTILDRAKGWLEKAHEKILDPKGVVFDENPEIVRSRLQAIAAEVDAISGLFETRLAASTAAETKTEEEAEAV